MAEQTMAMGKDPKFLCGVAVSVYQNSGTGTLAFSDGQTVTMRLLWLKICSQCLNVCPSLLSHIKFRPLFAGDPNANWAYFQEQKAAHVNFNLRLSTGCMTDFHEPGTDTGSLIEAEFPKLGPSKIQKNARIGKASDFWNRYEQDIKLSADLGVTQLRSSSSQHPLEIVARPDWTLLTAHG